MLKKRNNYWVTQTDDGWATKREGGKRAAGVFKTQQQAEKRARKILKNDGGGEMITKDRQGKIRSKDTINAPDPNPPKDKEH